MLAFQRRRCGYRRRQRKPVVKHVPDPGQLLAYTDGSTFRANPGPMSWAVVFVRDGAVADERTVTGCLHAGTNNRAELLAVIVALEHETTEHLTVMTDSMVTIKCATGVYRRHANRDLWARFDRALEVRSRRGLRTEFRHVKGHHVDPFNKMADALAAEHGRNAFAGLLQDDS